MLASGFDRGCANAQEDLSSRCHTSSMQIRVHELAKELGVTSRHVLAELRCLDHPVKSASSLVPAPVVEAVRASLTSSAHRTPAVRVAPLHPSAQSEEQFPEPSSRWSLSRRPAPPPIPDDLDYGSPPDPYAQLTAKEAARELGVVPATIRQWVRRSYLTSSGSRGRAHLYERQALQLAKAKAEARTSRVPRPRPFAPALARRPVTTNEAAEMARVSPSTIRMWVHRGYLNPLPRVGRGHQFDPLKVLRVARRR